MDDFEWEILVMFGIGIAVGVLLSCAIVSGIAGAW